MEIKQAILADLDNIKALQEKYHVSNLTEAEKQQKGFVTMRVTDEQFKVLIERKGVFIAVENNQLAAYSLTSDWDFYRQWPIINEMEAILPEFSAINGVKLTVDNSFQYGPVCIDEAFRGRDILTLLFDKILAFYKKDYAYATTFINKKNERSMRAHNKRTLLSIIGEFKFNDNEYYALACPTF